MAPRNDARHPELWSCQNHSGGGCTKAVLSAYWSAFGEASGSRQPPEHRAVLPDGAEDAAAGTVIVGWFPERARVATGRIHPDLLSRAAAFLLLHDSRASYNIESEYPSPDRVQRGLLHHVLSASGFAPEGIIFPVSAIMLREIGEYRKVLETYSTRLLPLIEWRPTLQDNVEVLNDTASWYRFFDTTAHAECIYRCVETTIEVDLPAEVGYLSKFDWFAGRLSRIVDMPSKTVHLLHRFLRQNGACCRSGRGAGSLRS